MHLASRENIADRKVGHDLLSHPPSIEKPLMRIRKAPFQVRNDSIIGDRRAEIIRVLEVKFMIGDTTWSGYELKKLFSSIQQRENQPEKGAPRFPSTGSPCSGS